MTEKKHVKIDDLNATVEHDFPFRKYEQVTMDEDGNTGTVIDAEWIGTDARATHYKITYWIKSNVNGAIREFQLPELLALNRDRH